MVHNKWISHGPPLEPGGQYDFEKVFIGGLERGTGPEQIKPVLRAAGFPEPHKVYTVEPGNSSVCAVYVTFPTENDAINCVKRLNGCHVFALNPHGKSLYAHRGEIQAVKRSGL